MLITIHRFRAALGLAAVTMVANSIGALLTGTAVLFLSASCFGAVDESDLQTLLGPKKRFRDSADFTTEKGERAALVLYVTNVQTPGGDRVEIEPPLSCGNEVAGIPLTGVYHVALVIGGALVNELTISPPGGGKDNLMALPTRNLPVFNYVHWGQGTPVEYNAEATHTEPTKLLRLADFNGDGHAWEFRLVQPTDACGHLNTLVAGYSPTRRVAVVYPILSGPLRSDWADNFFALPTVGNGVRVESTFACGDHGNERETWQEYLYDAASEVWVLHRHRERDCNDPAKDEETPVEPSGSPIALTVGSADGLPGERVSIEVPIDSGETPVGRIAHSIIVDPRVSVAAIAGFDFERNNQWTVAEDRIAPIHCTSELVASCEWAFRMRVDGDFRGRSVLYALKLAIPADARPGSYPLRNTDLGALGRSGKKLAVRGTDGVLRVRAPADR